MWPNLAQALLLVKITLNHVSQVYDLVPRESTLNQLEGIYQTSNFHDPMLTCKFFALFALGEAYSARAHSSSSSCRVPGTAYYVRAMTVISIFPERSNLIHVESLLLLVSFKLLRGTYEFFFFFPPTTRLLTILQSLFSYFLNRRHSGFFLTGNALRSALTIGLNHNIPERQCRDPMEREHRVRIWWAIYILDRMWSSKTGFPSEVSDDDIHVDMPSNVSAGSQFGDPEYCIAHINLARITGQIIDQVYSRKKYLETFLHREQKLLIALKNWMQTLPGSIRLDADHSTPKHILSLHLQFNQVRRIRSFSFGGEGVRSRELTDRRSV